MSAKSFDFSSPLPSYAIYADSSFILNLITSIRNRQERYQTDCEEFLKRIQSEMDLSGLALVTSDFGIDEICYKIIRESLENNIPFFDQPTGKTYYDSMELFKNRPEIIQRFLPKIENFYIFLDSIPILIVSYPELWGLSEPIHLQAKRFISTYNLLPADAFHVAIGKSAGINDFIALDTDWFRIDEINLYSCLPPP